ncbi:hypothetical protein AAVH_25916 [Aphelenchoides avenae]|nr:hypothetical protein AAVH_25916 [Aphelenchus avenae]
MNKQFHSLKAQVADFENHVCSIDDGVFQNDSARIAELESLLRSEKDANINLQRTIAEYESGSTGQRKSLVERAQEIGFVRDASGKLSLGSPASRGFDYSKPYTYINRWG